MRIAITQPNFLPWLGYFELLDWVDCYVVLDDVQLVRGSYVVRNRVLTSSGHPRWATMAVARCGLSTPLNEARVSSDRPWWEDLLRSLDAAYASTPHWHTLRAWLHDALPPRPSESVAAYNQRLLQDLAAMTGCSPGQWLRASDLTNLRDHDSQEARLIAICKTLGATDYVNFRKGIDIGLHDPERFARNGIRLWRQDYRHPVYAQDRADFASHLSIVDLLTRVGQDEIADVVRGGRAWMDMTAVSAA